MDLARSRKLFRLVVNVARRITGPAILSQVSPKSLNFNHLHRQARGTSHPKTPVRALSRVYHAHCPEVSHPQASLTMDRYFSVRCDDRHREKKE